MKRFLFLLAPVLFLGILHAQTPDWLPPAQLVQSGTADVPAPNGYFDNRAIEVQTLTVAYQSDGGISGFTIAAQYATGTNTPGSFSTLTPVASSSSFGTAQYGVATFNLLSATPGSSIPAPWIRVDVSGGTGVGGIRIEMYGYRTGPTGGTGGGGGGSGTGCPNPCPVVGTGTAGTPNAGVVSVQGVSGGTAEPVSQSGTWTVQPGNTPNTSPWLETINQGGNSAVVKAASTAAAAADPALVVSISPNSPTPAAPGLGTFTSGQQAVTASAAALATNTSKNVCLHAMIANAKNVYVGPSGVTTGTGMELPPGQGYCWQLNNTNLLFIIGTVADNVSWTSTN